MAEDVFPVCSPALLAGDRPLEQPEDLVDHTLLHVNLYPDEWLSWLTAAGLPTRLATGPGLYGALGVNWFDVDRVCATGAASVF